MFKNASDRAPVFFVLALSLIDFLVYFLVNEVWWLAGYTLLMIMPKGLICAWNHHHQHTLTFRSKPLNRLLEFFYALHTGVTTNLWVLHHVLGHHKNFLDQAKDESRWKRADGSTMGALEYTLIVAGTAYYRGFQVGRKHVAGTAYYRGFQVGRKHPRAQRKFLLYSAITFAGVALLCWFRTVPAIFVFLIPMVISLLLQHG